MVKYTPNEDDDEEDDDEMVVQMPKEGPKQKQMTAKNNQLSCEHFEIQFSDSSTKFCCKVFHARSFSEMRRTIMDGDESFIHSLSRSIPWRASGGKSGSNFSKTRDNRFFLKQMSPREVQSFTEFAPHYIQYVTACHRNNEVTTLAKIVGVYRVEHDKHNSSARSPNCEDILVIENLFCGQPLTQVYDLKGSIRNRLAENCLGSSDHSVLLDENLVRGMIGSPLYTRVLMKDQLMKSISADTKFLSSHSVMDYSLLVGVDEGTKKLVVGIIDYVRTFTWEKRMEMIFKTTCGKKMPTVQDPEVYRGRFLESMLKYLLAVPTMWHSFTYK